MKTEFSEINDKLEKLEGDFLNVLDEVSPLVLNEMKDEKGNIEMHQIEFSSCGCYVCCGSDYARNGKCSCYVSCGSNYSKG